MKRKRKRKRFYKLTKSVRDLSDPRYKTWRSSVYKRDGHRCQMPGCRYAGKVINAHHIRKWADMPHLRYDIHNGISLCYRCHKKVTGLELEYAPMFHNILASKHKGE